MAEDNDNVNDDIESEFESELDNLDFEPTVNNNKLDARRRLEEYMELKRLKEQIDF